MRMRKKKNCAARIERCGDIRITDPEAHKGKWSEVFGNDNPIHVEIGCGKGSFVVGMAKMYPDVNFIAIEKVEDVIVMAMEKAIENEVGNVLFMDLDAELIEDFFEKGEIERIYLNFSDPWKKSKQAKRRLTHKNFLDRYKKVLNSGSYIWFKTDNRKLFEFSLNEFAAFDVKMQNICLDLHNSNFEGNIVTEYEKAFATEYEKAYAAEYDKAYEAEEAKAYDALLAAEAAAKKILSTCSWVNVANSLCAFLVFSIAVCSASTLSMIS